MRAIGIRGQLIMMVATTIILSMLVASFFIRDLIYNNIIDQKRTTADILTSSIVHDIKYEYNYRSRVAIDSIISKYLTYYRIIKDMHYYALDSSTLVEGDKSSITILNNEKDLSKQLGTDIPGLDTAIQLALVKAKPSIEVTELKSKEIAIRSIAPVLQGSRVIGAISINLAIDDVNELLGEIFKQMTTILIIVVVIGAIILFAILRSSLLTRVSNLMGMTRAIAKGNYRSKLNDKRSDELGELSRAFDHMTEELYQSKIRIDNHNQIMDQKVQDATSELKLAYEDLKNAQGQIVLSEKMASLGVLIAGIAHEINTPVGAISNVSRHLDKKIHQLPSLMKSFDIEKDQLDEISALLNEVVLCAENSHGGTPSFKETRALEEVLSSNNIPDYRDKARVLATIHLTNLDRIAPYIPLLASESVFRLVETTGYIAQSAQISKTSAKKIQDIVHALKFYAYTDKDKVEATQINDSIKTSLVLINNRLKHLVNVSADLDDSLPEVLCTCEIHQIWTVLFNNALDAIDEMPDDYPGQINIKSYKDKENIYVEINDNGGGIPEETISQVFDPFFTTKDIGKGTGLGLSIVSGIVKKHRGVIHVVSEGKETTFKVTIPFKGISNEALAEMAATGNE